MKKPAIAIVNLAIFVACIIALCNSPSIEQLIFIGVFMVLHAFVLLIVAIVAYANNTGNGPTYMATLLIIVFVGWPGCFFAGLKGLF
jgi:hypothetical protein